MDKILNSNIDLFGGRSIDTVENYDLDNFLYFLDTMKKMPSGYLYSLDKESIELIFSLFNN